VSGTGSTGSAGGPGSPSTPGRLSRRERIDRSRARAWVLQIHYLWESGDRTGRLRDALVDVQRHRRIAPRRLPFIRSLLETLDEEGSTIDDALRECLDNWRLERVSAIDRAILRLAAAEILYLDEIPPRVSLQEAVHLAEAYGGNESPRFVNGVLDALYRRDRARA
jgi:N utilization substance protein B